MTGRMAGGDTFWWAGALGLCGLIAVELTQDLPLTPTVTAATTETAGDDLGSGSPPTVPLPSDAIIDDIIERPLFSPSRTPAVYESLEAGAPVDAHADLQGWSLVGTTLAGDAPIALMRHPKDRFMRLRLGQQIGGWRIFAITLRFASPCRRA